MENWFIGFVVLYACSFVWAVIRDTIHLRVVLKNKIVERSHVALQETIVSERKDFDRWKQEAMAEIHRLRKLQPALKKVSRPKKEDN